MVSDEVIDKIKELRDKEQTEPGDALVLFGLFKEIAEQEEEVKEELEDTDEIIVQNNYSDADFKYWVKLGEGKFDVGEGEAEEPTVIMSAAADTWAELGTGDLDATSAYMAGDLEIEGNLQDAITYGQILDLIREVIEEFED
ncbi:MAG: SCP-2 sterol transfer family protein [Promethearchaeota archaeon]|jgi:putative sterol carrier protein|nr:MAG: SCP-2 sterol transfer family protein [Candidatus Lokiarchaeota archaeon]